VFFYLIKGKNNQFFAVKTKLFLFFPFSEAGHVLKMFLFFEKFEPQRSYKQGSYRKKACILNYNVMNQREKDAQVRGFHSIKPQ